MMLMLDADAEYIHIEIVGAKCKSCSFWCVKSCQKYYIRLCMREFGDDNEKRGFYFYDRNGFHTSNSKKKIKARC